MSNDWPIGGAANMIQVWLFLRLMAQITGHEPAKAYHRSVNAHIYGNQLDLVPTQLERIPFNPPTLDINPDIKTLEDLESWVTLSDFELKGYQSYDKIDYPFAV